MGKIAPFLKRESLTFRDNDYADATAISKGLGTLDKLGNLY